jgi:hypothetical protein
VKQKKNDFLWLFENEEIPRILAFPISRAERLTMSPTIAYSRRLSDPTAPQNVRPVVIPIEGFKLQKRKTEKSKLCQSKFGPLNFKCLE